MEPKRNTHRRPLAVLLALAATVPFLALAAPTGPRGSLSGGARFLHLKVAEFDPLAGLPPLSPALRLDAEPPSGIFVLQLREKATPALVARLRAAGAELLEYLPEGAHIVRLPEGAAAGLRRMPETRWLGPLQPGWKLAPDLGRRPFRDPERRSRGLLSVTADLFAGEDPERAAAAARVAGAEVVQVMRFGRYARLKLRGSPEVLGRVARVDAVSWIEEVGEITPRNNTTRWVIQSNVPGVTSVWEHGIHGEGQIIGHIDGRLDVSSCFFRDPTDNTPGPSHRKVVAYRSSTGPGSDSHGTHTAGTAVGDQAPITGGLDSNGNAYGARISHSNVNDITGSGIQPSNLYDYLAAAHEDGARVHTNSWGDDGTTAYTTWCVDIDRFSWDHEDSLVMFAVTNLSTLKSPENAKNCLAVGASDNGTWAGDFCAGGRGPTSDGRRKPDIFAPGCSIVSARSDLGCATTAMTGTSMASPAVTAAAALVRQYYEEGWYPSGTRNAADRLVPSGALVKATLLNSAVDMTGISGYPSDEEGWGRVLLERALHFQDDARALSVMADVRNADGLSTGQAATYRLDVTGSSEALRVTLVWTEPPASLLASKATVNDLDLEVVSPSGTTYLGNVIDATTGLSLPGGSADTRNNVEMVLLASPEVGEWTVRVVGSAVNQGTQGYALVSTGQVGASALGSLRYESHQVQDSPPFGNDDGILDPGETATIRVVLHNTSSEAIGGIAGVLSSNLPGQIKITRQLASYPDLPAGASGSSFSPHYRLTAAPDLACGTRARFRVDTSSSEGQGSTTFRLDLGRTHEDYPAPGLPLPIPELTSSPLESSLDVPDAFTARDVNVQLDVGHGDVGELVVTLRSPSGTTVTLHNRSGGGTQDITTVYDRERQPDGPGTMSDFDGEPAQGRWSLSIDDRVGGATPEGTLRSWTLELEATDSISCTPLACADPVPGEVPPALVLAKESGADLRFTWPEVPGASSYRVWQSPGPDFSAAEMLVGTATDTTLLDTGALLEPTSWFYEVRGVNSCEWEGP